MSSRTSNAPGTCKRKYIWHPQTTYVLDLAQIAAHATLHYRCGKSCSTLWWQARTTISLAPQISNTTHTLIQAQQAFRKDREMSSPLHQVTQASEAQQAHKRMLHPFLGFLGSCQAGSVCRHPRTKKARGFPGTKGDCTRNGGARARVVLRGLSPFLPHREGGKEAPQCFVIPGIHVFSCTQLSFLIDVATCPSTS